MGILDKLKRGATFALDLTSAIAKNPLAILAPVKEAEKIKQLRADIAAGDRSKATTYIKTVGVQTAINVGGTLAAGGALGAAAAKTATTLGSKALTLGVVASPLIVGSSTIRQTVAATSPVALGVSAGEKLEKAISTGSEGASTAAKVVGTIAAGAVGAGVILAGKELYDKYKDSKELPTDNALTPSTSLTPTIATNQSVPVVPATTTVTTGTGSLGGKTKRKRKKKREVPYINIKIDNREDNDINDRKVYKGGRF
jgi:hypothetical protein